MKIQVTVNTKHYCKVEKRMVEVGETLFLSRAEVQKRQSITKGGVPLVAVVLAARTEVVDGPTENQSVGPEELEVKRSKSRLQQMKKDELKALSEQTGVVVDEGSTKADIIDSLLEDNTDDTDD